VLPASWFWGLRLQGGEDHVDIWVTLGRGYVRMGWGGVYLLRLDCHLATALRVDGLGTLGLRGCDDTKCCFGSSPFVCTLSGHKMELLCVYSG